MKKSIVRLKISNLIWERQTKEVLKVKYNVKSNNYTPCENIGGRSISSSRRELSSTLKIYNGAH